jgi:nucleoside-diphosphate-sugar epimerase
MVRAGQPVTAITNPGRPGIGHQWAYLPDVAETMVRLLERNDRNETFESFHMQGHWDADGTAMVDAIRRVIGRPDVKVRSMPWGLIRLASPFVPLFRELAEIRYLWETPLRMPNARLVEALGAEPHTPLDLAVRETLVGLGCMENQGAASPHPQEGQGRSTCSTGAVSTV